MKRRVAFSLPPDIYNNVLVVCVGASQEEAAADVIRLTRKRSAPIRQAAEAVAEHVIALDGIHSGYVAYCKQTFLMILAGLDTDEPWDMSVLGHECLHVVTATFAQVGIEIHTGQDEPAAYYLSYLMANILRKYEKARK